MHPLYTHLTMKWMWAGLALAAGCGTPYEAPEPLPPSAAVATPAEEVSIDPPEGSMKILFLGNSHTAFNDLPLMVKSLLSAYAAKPIHTRHIFSGFLNDLAENPSVSEALTKTKWDVVVLQGALLSSSHSREYPNPGIVKLTKAAIKKGARPLYFVEWPRKGWDESEFQMGHYRKFAKQSGGGELVPVCLAWDEALKKEPKLDLWSGDGNHANLSGSYLAACTIAYWIDRSALESNWKPNEIDAASAARLRSYARETVESSLERKPQSSRGNR